MLRIPNFFSLVLIAVLTFGIGAGQIIRALHEIDAAGQVTHVICGESGTTTVTVDREGNPVTPAESCAHCSSCLHFAVALPLPFGPAACRSNLSDTMPRAEFTSAELKRLWRPEARGPPAAKET